MKLVPSSKIDFNACDNLAVATDEEIAPLATELLEWLQDMNWPVAPLVQQRLAQVGTRLVEPIRDILKGNDEVWKFWIMISLLPSMSDDVVAALYPELHQIAVNPTEGERLEEVDAEAQHLLARASTLRSI